MPADDRWLGDAERERLAVLVVARRRADWRLGRWAAKAAASAWMGVAPQRVQVLPAPDGAPEVWLDDRRAPVSLSLSHRAGRALVAIADAPAAVGCDLEVVEPRSPAFARAWLSAAEQDRLAHCDPDDRACWANLAWTGKEAAAKVRREGLRLDVRRAAVVVRGWRAGMSSARTGWQPLLVGWNAAGGAATTAGWWRVEPGWVMCIAASAEEPDLAVPRPIAEAA